MSGAKATPGMSFDIVSLPRMLPNCYSFSEIAYPPLLNLS